jgi:hypothetical protein
VVFSTLVPQSGLQKLQTFGEQECNSLRIQSAVEAFDSLTAPNDANLCEKINVPKMRMNMVTQVWARS